MASLQHQSVQFSSSDPHPCAVGVAPDSPSQRRNIQSASDNHIPASPREGKRKRLLHNETSSPNISHKQRKQSTGRHGRHSIVIEPPQVPCIAWDNNSDQLSAARSETSSIHSESSADLSLTEPDESSLICIRHIVNELITTEKVYMQDLQDILMGYMRKMESSDLFQTDHISDIFVNIKSIGDFHMGFLIKLDEYQKDLEKLIECFLDKESDVGFSLYNEFCRNVPRSLDLVAAILKDESARPFMMACQEELHHIFPLTEFLHRPIQRVLKYPLLLRELQKYSKATRYTSLVEAALDRITGVAVHINKVKRVQELDSNEISGWTGDPLLDYGILKLEDTFKVNKEPRHVFLFEKLLLITKIKENKYNYKAHLSPTDITMTESIPDDKENTKFEISDYNHKKTKFIVQAPDTQIRKTWLTEIKRCMLELRPDIPVATRQALLNEIPTYITGSNQLDNIINSAKYKDLRIINSVDLSDNLHTLTTVTTSSTPDTPQRNTFYQRTSVSPVVPDKSPSPQPNNYLSPSPEHLEQEEQPADGDTPSKNTVDYSSLDVKSIKERWKKAEKMEGANTVPPRPGLSERKSKQSADTWPINNDKRSSLIDLKSNASVTSLKDNFTKTPSPVTAEKDIPKSRSASPRKNTDMPLYGSQVAESAAAAGPAPQDYINKHVLARISHLNKPADIIAPHVRDIQTLLQTDLANSQDGYLLSPDSNIDHETDNLMSGLDKRGVLSPKQSNGSDEVFVPYSSSQSRDMTSPSTNTTRPNNANSATLNTTRPNNANSATLKTNLRTDNYVNKPDIDKLDMSSQSRDLSRDLSRDTADNDELISRLKTCTVSGGSDTTKRNSFILPKEDMTNKDLSLFSPATSDSEAVMSDASAASQADRVAGLKKRWDKQKQKQKLEKVESPEKVVSPESDLIGVYDAEAAKSRTPSPEEVTDMSDRFHKMKTDTTGSETPTDTNSVGIKYTGRAIKTEVKLRGDKSTLTRDDTLTREDTLTRDKDTLTRDNSHYHYQGSSLIRGATGSTVDTDEEGAIVMKPLRPAAASSPKSKRSPKSRSRRARQQSSGSSEEDSRSTTTRRQIPGGNKKPSSGLPKPGARRGLTTDEDSDMSATMTTTRAASNTVVRKAALKKRQIPSSIPRSDSNSSIPSVRSTTPRSRDNSRSRENSARDRRDSRGSTGSRGKSRDVTSSKPQSRDLTKTTSKYAAKPRTPSFNQEDNPFSSHCTTSRPQPQARRATAPKANLSKSLPTETQQPTPQPNKAKSRGTRLGSEGTASDLKSRYLDAASKAAFKKPEPKRGRKSNTSDPDVQELKSVRQSNLVSKMKTQLAANNTQK